MARQKMKATRKQKFGCSRAASVLVHDQDGHSNSNDSASSRSESEAPGQRGSCTEEFDDPVDLSNIRPEIRDRMLEAAPMLMGRDAEYGRHFFTVRVGLYAEGPLLKDVSKTYAFISDEEVRHVWRVGSLPNRYEMANCTRPEQLKIFGQHYYNVYGNKPDNSYYSLRFLKACYATFIHGKPVNWCAQAMGRLKHRLKNQQRNPQKLGPIATRCQVEGLCKIIAELSCTSNAASSENAAPLQSLLAAQEEERIRSAEVKIAASTFVETRRKLDDAFHKFDAQDEGAEEALQVAYLAASKDAKRLLREGATDIKYAEKAAEVKDLQARIDRFREADVTFQQEIRALESVVALQRAKHETAVAALASAQAKVAKARRQSYTIQVPPAFEFPQAESIPPLPFPGRQTCAYCGLGFVWKAAVLSSCGCFLHPVCVAEIIADQNYRCNRCKDVHLASSPVHLTGPWIAQFGGILEHQQAECTGLSSILRDVREDGEIPTNDVIGANKKYKGPVV